jgi:hypothetical protein
LHKTGEEQKCVSGVTVWCWDDILQDQLAEFDAARTEQLDTSLECTSRAALWGCNAVTITAAAELNADSECFRYFSAHHRNRCLQAIARAHAQQGKGMCADVLRPCVIACTGIASLTKT